jgi:hypothetical protein
MLTSILSTTLGRWLAMHNAPLHSPVGLLGDHSGGWLVAPWLDAAESVPHKMDAIDTIVSFLCR